MTFLLSRDERQGLTDSVVVVERGQHVRKKTTDDDERPHDEEVEKINFDHGRLTFLGKGTRHRDSWLVGTRCAATDRGSDWSGR